MATSLDEPAPGCALLVLPGIGASVTVSLLSFIMSDDSIWSALIQLIPWPQSAGGKVITQVIRFVVAYLPILVVSGGLAWLTNWIPLLHPIAEHFRQDWSRLSFLMYGVALLPVLIQDEYSGLGLYQLGSLAILMGGALAYLRPANSWSRFLTLLGALGLSLGLLSFGIYSLYPQQSWAAHTTFPRWWEAVYPLIQGTALAFLMVLPAILALLPTGKSEFSGVHR